MFLYETILFYKGVPSYYKVHKQENKYFFEAVPLEYYKDTNFPDFFAEEVNQQWQINGTESRDLIEQAVADLQKYSYLIMADA